MKNLLLLFAAVGLFACSQSPKNIGSQQSNATYLTFKFGTVKASMEVTDPSNWCTGNYGESALINADPKNYFRRLFALSNVPCKVIIDFGHQTAALMLYKKGDHVELYTSDNMPACLSDKANFQIAPEGNSFRYDNKREISFDVYLQEQPNGIQIALDLPPNGGHGMSVLRCESCK